MSQRRNIMLATVALACLALAARQSAAEDGGEPPDLLDVAALLIADGHIERAAATLGQIDPEAPALDRGRYHTLRGMVALEQRDFAAARKSLDAALANGQRDPVAHIYLAKAQAGVGDHAACQETLTGAGAAIDGLVSAWLLRAECATRLGEFAAAWRALEAAERRFSENTTIARYQFLLLVETGLFQAAIERGRRYLEREEATAGDYIALAEALLNAKEPARAVTLMEEARLRFQEDADVATKLALAHLAAGAPLGAAMVLEQVAMRDPARAADAAELYRRAGKLELAAYLNMSEPDQRKKLRQRLGLLVEKQSFEEAAALEGRLMRLGLLEDEDILYALAYAAVKVGRYAEAEPLLARITDRRRFADVTALREIMQREGAHPETYE